MILSYDETVWLSRGWREDEVRPPGQDRRAPAGAGKGNQLSEPKLELLFDDAILGGR